MSGRPQRVLVLAYMFPPLGGGGVQRTLKHVKYLPEHGYESVVVTTDGRWYPPRDETMLAEVPQGTRVLAARELPFVRLRALALNPLHRLRMRWLLHLLRWPDDYAGWIPGCFWTTWRAARRLRPAVLYSTSSPMSAHVVAFVVSRLTGLPWVADFRDSWTLSPQKEPMPPLLSRAGAALERRLTSRADRIVVADDSVELAGVAADDPRRVVIRNGVDPDDITELPEPRRRSRLQIAYVGTLYGARDVAPVLAAAAKLIDRGDVEREELELRVVGSDFRSPERRGGPELVVVTACGYVDHRRALAEMVGADVLLLYQAPGQRGMSGKIYEYLATGRPVLCVAPADNLAYRVVAELGAGECAEPDDPAGIEAAILALYHRWKDGRLEPNAAVRETALERYSRPRLTAELAGVLDAAIDERSSH